MGLQLTEEDLMLMGIVTTQLPKTKTLWLFRWFDRPYVVQRDESLLIGGRTKWTYPIDGVRFVDPTIKKEEEKPKIILLDK